MAVSGDVTFAQDGGHSNVKLHPYFVALVRWCVSCVWSTATVILHRLVAGSIPGHTIAGITVPRPPKSRAASSEHLSREPKVECQVLHTPATHTADVIFVHGLYGSLGNTWRQGDWRSKYKIEPDKVPLLRPATCKCQIEPNLNNNNMNEYENINEATYKRMEEKFYDGIKQIIPNDEAFITEKFYTNTLLDQVQIVDNYETQAKFVRDLFESENRVCDNNIQGCDSNFDSMKFECELDADNCETNEVAHKLNEVNCNCEANEVVQNLNEVNCNYKVNEVALELNEVNCNCEVEINSRVNGDMLKVNEDNCECNVSDVGEGRKCLVGCGCVCDVCYSSCWPRDWIKEDYPEARVISINYTSDPYLWRPIWIKECKRLRLHERAEQMTKQLLELGVGRKPVIWVGHSKGGLFIKQIYCEAYEAYLKTQNQHRTKTKMDDNERIYENENLSCRVNEKDNIHFRNLQKDSVLEPSNINLCKNHFVDENTRETLELNDNVLSANNRRQYKNVMNIDNERGIGDIDNAAQSSDNEEDYSARQADLWSNSVGFMFYSVPHRGSPLADIKTPITARSIELLEISEDCALVLSLQARWLHATLPSRPQVRSLVETCRTLMAVLWLRIVSVPSADAGIGALYGVSVDHREICKPSSRRCLLYAELMALMHAALRHCRCDAAQVDSELPASNLRH